MDSSTSMAHNQFGALVGQLARQWRRAVNRRLQPLGLTEATWLPMLHLARAGQAMRQKDLAASLGLDSSSVVRLLDELQAAGLIERREGADRRAKEIHMTTRGHTVVKQVNVLTAELRAQTLAGADANELEIAFQVLTQLSAVLASAEEKKS